MTKKRFIVCRIRLQGVSRNGRSSRCPKGRVLVVGAGVSGLEAALDFALRGAQVEVWEAQTHAGGLIELAKLPPHKAVLERLIAYRLAMLEHAMRHSQFAVHGVKQLCYAVFHYPS